jgi:hypothetical protein
LRSIQDLSGQAAKDRTLSDCRFSLLFTSTSVLDQGTRTVSHPALGETALFVVPVGPPATTRKYMVIVNRLA